MFDESKHTQATASAVAVSGGAGAVANIAWQAEAPIGGFSNVPAAKRLFITDVLLFPQGDMTAPHTVNLAEKSAGGGTRIFFQFRVLVGVSEQVHFLTGHLIAAGSQVVTFTDANPPAGQHISVALNGYLTK